MELEIDIERLRNDLINYFGTAMYSGYPQAINELYKVESANDEEIIEIAITNNFDLSKYTSKVKTRTRGKGEYIW